MGCALVILAAGVGRRFGGAKQLEPVGPGSAALVDYTIYDALKIGFDQIVFVVRPEMEAGFRETFGARYGRRVAIAFAQQRLDALPSGFHVPGDRTRPWGTGHAVRSAAPVVAGPFAVVNADDFYGRASLAAIHDFLAAPPTAGIPVYGLVGYTLRNTLPDQGAVARAVCSNTADGWLESIVEITGIEKCGAAQICVAESDVARPLGGDETVSMNLWGFFPDIFDALRVSFSRFLQEKGHLTDVEFYLPAVVQQLLSEQRARVRVLPTTDKWCGITHPLDREPVVAFLAKLVARGVYPARLWN